MIPQPKIVFIDIDGTLLNNHHQISEATTKAIKAATEKGIKVILATARPYYGADIFRKQLILTTPIICFNGGLIIDEVGKVLVDHKIAVGQAKILTEIATSLNVNLIYLDAERSYALKNDQWLAMEEELTDKKSEVLSFERIAASWSERESTGPNKIMAVGPPDQISALELKIKSVVGNELTVNISHPSYLENTNALASKQQGAAFLLEQFGFKNHEMVAIGDSFNDIDMLRFAGVGVAMGNAHDKVKQAADWVTKSNDQDGVAHALIQIFDL
uniref:Cof-type HAD-IIB family hydrolase n=1 Tax=Fulvivirga sp. TaxID=1931237 RepID=UPI004049EF6F